MCWHLRVGVSLLVEENFAHSTIAIYRDAQRVGFGGAEGLLAQVDQVQAAHLPAVANFHWQLANTNFFAVDLSSRNHAVRSVVGYFEYASFERFVEDCYGEGNEFVEGLEMEGEVPENGNVAILLQVPSY